MSEQFDAIVIGAGQAGPTLAARLAGAGHKTALIERRRLGGSCVNFGCTPTKAMVASARAAWMARRAGDLGVRIGGAVAVDMAAVQRHAAEVVEQSRQGLRRWLGSIEGLYIIEGHARFASPHGLTVDNGAGVLSAERIFINTGTRAQVPDIPGLATAPYWTPSDITGLERLPEHLVILGGGYIGVEYAQMFRRFGSRVTLVERGQRLLAGEDPETSAAMRTLLEDEGVEVLLATAATAVADSGDGVAVTVAGPGDDQREVGGSHLLVALGRRPNSDDLELEAAGVTTDERGYIEVDERLHTAVEGIWALGDVNGSGAFTHTAYNDHQIVADELFGHGARTLHDRIAAHAVFTDPPLARVGITEAEARRSPHRILAARLPMDQVARAREMGETRGFMKVLVDGDNDRILGATILGVGGDEAVHGILDMMYACAPARVLRDSVGIHPTVSELIPTLLERLEPLDPPQDPASA